MDFFTHFFFGFLLSACTVNALGIEFFFFSSLMSMLPDFDVFLHPLAKKKESYFLSHRGGSHSYIMSLFVSAITSGIFFLLTGKSFILAYIIGCIFYSLHVTLDLFTTSKIPIFYPISKKEYRLMVDRAVNLLLMLISLTTIITYIILLNFWIRLYYSENIWRVILACYLIYFVYKILTKMWVKARLPDNCQFLPGIFPFVYSIYENKSNENHISFKLTKKFQFSSKSVEVIESKIKNNSIEMKFFERTKKLFEKFRFFKKWEAVIPIIWENDSNINVLIFLAESYANGTAYNLEISYDKNSGTINKTSYGFSKVMIKAKN